MKLKRLNKPSAYSAGIWGTADGRFFITRRWSERYKWSISPAYASPTFAVEHAWLSCAGLAEPATFRRRKDAMAALELALATNPYP